jgi:poly-gamma-glutamate capsule biosynthesis protein CapA/YwtB (metallophosphatase superfamily)
MNELLFLGDFLYDYDYIAKDIDEISNWIQKHNYSVILNLEAPIGNLGSKIKKRGPNLFQSSTSIEILKKLNVVGVCIANNHIADYGKKSLIETTEILRNNNILYNGAGINILNALKPMDLEIDGVKIIIQSFAWNIEEAKNASLYSYGTSPRNKRIIKCATKRIKYEHVNSFLVNIYHWGFEYNLYPMPFDIELAHQSINWGCDLIIGHHPHVIQPYENFKGKNIYYSLGNFYLSSRRDKFRSRIFKRQYPNRADYGMGVILNVLNRETRNIFIKYDSSINKTVIIDDGSFADLLEDITDYNYKSKDYVKKVKENSININPILTENILCNLLKLFKLKIYYVFIRSAKYLYLFIKTILYKTMGTSVH